MSELTLVEVRKSVQIRNLTTRWTYYDRLVTLYMTIYEIKTGS